MPFKMAASDPMQTLGSGGSAPVPVNTAVPVITGTTTVGQMLTGTNGTWTNTPTSYAKQWKANDVNITGATNSTYVLTATEVGKVITFSVLASNAGGAALSAATSAATSAVAAAPATAVSTHTAVPASNTISPSGSYAQLTDQTGNGYHFVQATDANKPATSTFGVGIDKAAFDGTNDYMTSTAHIMPTITADSVGATVGWALKIPAGSSFTTIDSEGSSSSGTPSLKFRDNGSGSMIMLIKSDANTSVVNNSVVIPGCFDDNPHCVVITIDKAAGTITGYLDGVAQTPVSFTMTACTLNVAGLFCFNSNGAISSYHTGGLMAREVWAGVKDATWRAAFLADCQTNHGTP